MSSMWNIIERLIKLWKGDPWLKTGKTIFLVSLASISGIFPELTIFYLNLSVSLANTVSIVCTFIATIGSLVGLSLIGFRYFQMNSHPPVLYYGQGMKNMDNNPPVMALPLAERGFVRPEILGEINSYDKDILLDKLNYYRHLFEEKTKHRDAPKIYLVALGSFPYLFVLGSLLRNAHNTVRILDHSRNSPGGNKWYLLDTITDAKITHCVQDNEGQSYLTALEELVSGDHQELGVALSYTFEISRKDLPETLRDSTVILKHSLGYGLDKLSNEALQEQLLSELSVVLNILGKNANRIHLFVAAQSSMCINIGKCYQDNVYGSLELYSYTKDQGYNWSITYNQGAFS